jgi:hypothetical protein
VALAMDFTKARMTSRNHFHRPRGPEAEIPIGCGSPKYSVFGIVMDNFNIVTDNFEIERDKFSIVKDNFKIQTIADSRRVPF